MDKITIKKRHIYALILAALLLVFIGCCYLVDRGNRQALGVAALMENPVFIVDAGHGSPDGGAVGADGTLEKDINLAIAMYLRDFLRAFGHEVIMTREGDESIHGEEATTIRQKKVSDIHKRTALVNDTPRAVLLSIHQNKFPQEHVNGMQTFYSPNNLKSFALAQSIQDSVRELTQPKNHRKVKPAGNNIYLLRYAQAPAVLIECGFISNSAEREKLKTIQYQKDLAFAIALGVLG